MGSICLPYDTHEGELTFHRNCKRVASEEIVIAALQASGLILMFALS
jgi:hypothetical protein